jgi:predicted amidohydrolase YtcJ
MSLMTAVVPVPSAARRKRALALACEALLSHGITAVHDMGDISLGLKGHASAQRVWDDLLLLRQAQVRASLVMLWSCDFVRRGARIAKKLLQTSAGDSGWPP